MLEGESGEVDQTVGPSLGCRALVVMGARHCERLQRRSHRLQLNAIPPASLARPLRVDAQLTARDTDNIKTWNGSIKTRVTGVSFPRLAAWLELPYQPQQGWGALHVRFGARSF